MADVPEKKKRKNGGDKRKIIKVMMPEVTVIPVIKEEDVLRLAEFQCSINEMAAFLKCSHEYLSNHFADTIKKGYEVGKKGLRRRMYEAAMNGNTAIMIWLSKQYLGMKDKQEEEAQVVNFNVQVNQVPK